MSTGNEEKELIKASGGTDENPGSALKTYES